MRPTSARTLNGAMAAACISGELRYLREHMLGCSHEMANGLHTNSSKGASGGRCIAMGMGACSLRTDNSVATGWIRKS